MKTFKEQQIARVKILKAEFVYRKSLKEYERGNYDNDKSEANLDRLNEVIADYKIATIQLAEAERALVAYTKYEIYMKSEFKKEYTG